MMWPYGFGFMGWWMVLPGILFWGGLIVLFVWGIRRLPAAGGPMHGRSALDVARERYARGEISREQFEQLKKDMS